MAQIECRTHGHREHTLELSECHLLPGLSRNRLEQQLRSSTRVEMLEEAISTGLAETSDLFDQLIR